MKTEFLHPLADLSSFRPGEEVIQLLPDAEPSLRFLEVLDPDDGEIVDLSTGELLRLRQGWFLPLAKRGELPQLQDLQSAVKDEVYRNFFTGEIVTICAAEEDSLEVLRQGDCDTRLIARCCGAHFHRI
jgi:hypothetical protein